MIGKQVNGTVTARYLYDGQLKPVAVVDGEGNVERRYLYALHANVPEAILEADGTTYRIIHDHLGSPRMVVNAATGEIVKEVAYDEFGNITTETGTYALPFGFAGGIRDTDTGLTKFGARWYDPEVGRWITKDPIMFDGGLNHYAYANNDPVNLIDVTGLDPTILYKDLKHALHNAAINIYFKGMDAPFEWGTILYELEEDGEMRYGYTDPVNKGRYGQVDMTKAFPLVPRKAQMLLFLHNHPNGSILHQLDIVTAEGFKMDVIAVMMGGLSNDGDVAYSRVNRHVLDEIYPEYTGPGIIFNLHRILK